MISQLKNVFTMCHIRPPSDETAKYSLTPFETWI